ncbi:MAG: ribosome hibernation-promoting factor, HPF/YfiA family [Asticcacaulis sp.]
MQIQVSGKHVEVGDALRERIETELNDGIVKYFDRGGEAEVIISRQGYLFKADCWVRLASGQTLVAHAFGSDAHQAFNGTLDNIEKRVRRYKRRLKNHHSDGQGSERAPMTVLRALDAADGDGFGGGATDGLGDADEFDDGMDHGAPPQAMVIAETEAPIRAMTVSQAVLELEMSNYPVIMFRNAAHGGLSVIYRRPDGNIGWIDPERTKNRKVS